MVAIENRMSQIFAGAGKWAGVGGFNVGCELSCGEVWRAIVVKDPENFIEIFFGGRLVQ